MYFEILSLIYSSDLFSQLSESPYKCSWTVESVAASGSQLISSHCSCAGKISRKILSIGFAVQLLPVSMVN